MGELDAGFTKCLTCKRAAAAPGVNHHAVRFYQSVPSPGRVEVGDQAAARADRADIGDGGKAITFRDCPLAGPLPYRGSDIGFFAGLYRVEIGNFSDSVLSLIGDIGSSLGFELSKYLDIGRQLTSRLPSLLAVASGEDQRGDATRRGGNCAASRRSIDPS